MCMHGRCLLFCLYFLCIFLFHSMLLFNEILHLDSVFVMLLQVLTWRNAAQLVPFHHWAARGIESVCFKLCLFVSDYVSLNRSGLRWMFLLILGQNSAETCLLSFYYQCNVFTWAFHVMAWFKCFYFDWGNIYLFFSPHRCRGWSPPGLSLVSVNCMFVWMCCIGESMWVPNGTLPFLWVNLPATARGKASETWIHFHF